MKIRNIALVLCLIPFAVYGAERASSARVGMTRGGDTARMPSMASINSRKIPATPVVEQRANTVETEDAETEDVQEPVVNSESCRDVYRRCMDEFCLLDETEGGRCACSDNIKNSKKLIQEIQRIQSEADELYTTGVEREKLGAKAKIIFGESEAAKKSFERSGVDYAGWVNADENEDDVDLGEDIDIGKGLFDMASEACAAELEACGNRSKTEQTLYNRMIVNDCKAFGTYLSDQKREAEMNKRTAEAAVRSARLEVFDTTNKYNRGQCLLVYRSCVADQGGCGVNFENCLDEGLLSRRANACEGVLDQCMAVRDNVQKDWKAEQEGILKEAKKYADKNQRATCLAKIQNCLEEGCSTSTETACLTNIDVAAGICPIITECNEKIDGLKDAINDKLAYLQLKFCENDVDSCLKDKCGVDFTKPECVGKKASDIAETMCPQNIFPSCKKMSEDDFAVITNSAMLHMDYQLLTGCINQYAEKLAAVCGTDMACISVSELLTADKETADTYGFVTAANGLNIKLNMDEWVDLNSTKGQLLKAAVRKSADKAVNNFFDKFEKDFTLSACADVLGGSSTRTDRRSVNDSVNMAAKLAAYTSAEARATRELASLMDDLKIQKETDASRKKCLETYKKESKPSDSDSKNYSYIRSVSYEPSLHSCHVCRMQQVCQKGGESKLSMASKYAAGGAAGGAGIGTMVNPGLGTAIVGAIGALGAGIAGYMTGGEEDFCQALESCEDINIQESGI